MKILVDSHHADLFYSLQLLFEKRLGWEFYTQIETDWYTQGFWKVHDALDTAKQFLSLDAIKAVQGMHNVPEEFQLQELESGIYRVPDPLRPGVTFKGVTLEAFKDMEFDVLLSSMPPHAPLFNKLIQAYQPNAKHIFQAGNNWGNDIPVKNVLTSAKGLCIPHGANSCYYHQEFDLNSFSRSPTPKKNKVSNYQHIMNFAQLFQQVESHLPEWEFKAHGVGNRDGDLSIHRIKMAKHFQETGFTWHVKSADEGYGYNIHYSYATGTPMIVNTSFQRGFTAELLYEPGVNCIDVNGKTPQQIASELQNAYDNYDKWSDAAYNKFQQVVDFDKEFESIQKFIEDLR